MLSMVNYLPNSELVNNAKIQIDSAIDPDNNTLTPKARNESAFSWATKKSLLEGEVFHWFITRIDHFLLVI